MITVYVARMTIEVVSGIETTHERGPFTLRADADASVDAARAHPGFRRAALSQHDVEPLAVACTLCGAPAWTSCRAPGGAQAAPHSKRITSAIRAS